jgi:protein-tyrosine phosphatase
MNGWLRNNYGSRRGFLKIWWSRVQNLAGYYRDYRAVDWEGVERLVFVCQGNICRSAYAGARAEMQGNKAVSYGLATQAGLPANERAIEVAARRGIGLERHRTAPIEEYRPEAGDLLVAMEPWQASSLRDIYGTSSACTLLGLWGRPITPHIQDPYGATPEYFNHCFNNIDIAVNEILGKISEKY